MEKVNELLSLCKCSVTITVNQHRDYYESVQEYFKDKPEHLEDIETSVFEEMMRLNTIVEVQVYPNTPIGSWIVFHYDLETAIQDVINCIKSDNNH